MQRSTRHFRLAAGILVLLAGALVTLRIGGTDPAASDQAGARNQAETRDRSEADGDEALNVVELSADTAAQSQSDGSLAASISLPMPDDDALVFHPVIVTGYSSTVAQTDSTPNLTASMTLVGPGCLALSRDLLRTFTPDAPFDFGDGAVIPGVGLFIVQDTMHPRWTNRADIWFEDSCQAVTWGRRQVLIARLPSPVAESSPSLALGLHIRDFSHVAHH